MGFGEEAMRHLTEQQAMRGGGPILPQPHAIDCCGFNDIDDSLVQYSAPALIHTILVT